jgi:crotonobetainyl-CoA:carnitine CoA-transferase CaiB-like acyl-CoA transferase
MVGLSRPVSFSTAERDELPLAPRLGADARAVLAAAGYAAAEVEALILSGAVLAPATSG